MQDLNNDIKSYCVAKNPNLLCHKLKEPGVNIPISQEQALV